MKVLKVLAFALIATMTVSAAEAQMHHRVVHHRHVIIHHHHRMMHHR